MNKTTEQIIVNSVKRSGKTETKTKLDTKIYAKNTTMKRMLDIDFKCECYYDDGYVYEKNNYGNIQRKKLISPSRLMRTINEIKMLNIPAFTLEKARDRGKRLMENLEYWFENQCAYLDIPFATPEEERTVRPIFDWLLENKAQVLAVEKFIHNGTYCGIMDLVIRMDGIIYIVEIKTRTKNEVRETDLLQLWVYGHICKQAPTILMILDKDYKVHVHYPFYREIRQYWNQTKRYLNFMGCSLKPIEPFFKR